MIRATIKWDGIQDSLVSLANSLLESGKKLKQKKLKVTVKVVKNVRKLKII